MSTEKPLVCVTGASGFIGSHVVRDLLERGYRVRGTVSDTEDPARNDHLWSLPGAAGRLEVYGADLMAPGSFDRIIDGCDWVIHVATRVAFVSRDPQHEIVDVAVKGTRNVLSAIGKARTVKRVGLTSSAAAILSTWARPGHVFTEDDWTEDATVRTNPYGLGKSLSERSVWDFRESLPSDRRFDLMVVNPVVVTGPVFAPIHVRTSVSVVSDLYRGKLPACPRFALGLVDVRDVVAALIRGLEEGRTGRYLLWESTLWWSEIGRIIKKHFPDSPAPTRDIPRPLLYLIALFHKRMTVSLVRRQLGRKDRFSNEKLTRDLGIRPYPTEQSIVDTCNSLDRLEKGEDRGPGSGAK